MPSKIRVRHGRHAKRKKWPKGHACESNPTTRKFRDEAKSGLSLPDSDGNERQVKSSFADFKMTGEREDSEDDIACEIENLSLSGVTNLTTFSQCTNTSFTNLENLWNSRMESHQDICAVLAAVTQVIKSKGGSESDTDYFAALSAALESADNITTATSVAFLLSIIISKVPDAVLQSQYSHLTKLISAKFDMFETNEDGTSLTRSLLACLSTLLSKQPLDSWQETFTQNMFYRILQQTISNKPKVRKIAHHGMTVLTENALVNIRDEAGAKSREPIVPHPIWKISSQFFQEIFQKHTRKDQIKNIFHLLNLLKFILHLFPSQQLKHLCECVLKCSTSKNRHLHSLSIRILQTMFMHAPHTSCLTWQLNSQIILALYEIYPKPHEIDLIEPWLGSVQYGLTHLADTNPAESQAKTTGLFAVCFEYLRFCHSTVLFNRIVNTLQIVMEKCFIEHKDILKKSLSDTSSFVIQIIDAIQSTLISRNPDSIPHILEIQATAFRIFDRESSEMIKSNVQFLAVTVKNWPEIANHSADLEHALAVAVEVVGVEKFLEFVPLKLTEDPPDLSNSWVLPFLKSCVKNEEIGYFKSHFIPMATEIRRKATQFAEEGDELKAKICETLESQIWDLLPAFFKTAVQVPTDFPTVARLLGTMLQERVDLRNNIATALRQLIEHHVDDDLAIDCIRKYCKNYLPILFNLYVECDAKHHNKTIVLGCLSSFIKVSSPDLVDQYFNKIGTMLNSNDTDETKKPVLLDLGACMLPYINSSQLGLTLKQTEHYLTTENQSLQKKGYLALERMLNLSKEEHVQFMESNIKRIKSILLSSVSKLNPNSKKYRLKCLFSVLNMTECKDNAFITAILPEVIVSMKAINVELRNISYNILLLIGKFALEMGENKHKILESFIDKISAGLEGGTEHMQSCTILCLGKLVHEFRFSLSNESVEKLLRAVYVFSESTTRQIIKYCLYFLNVVVSVMNIGFVMEHLNTLVTRMIKWNKNANNQFLVKVKVITEKMLRKVDLEHVSEAFPNSHKNLLRSVRKSADKRKREKDAKRERRFEDSIEETDSTTVVSKGLVPAGFDELMLSDEEIERDSKSHKTQSVKSKGKQKKKSRMWIDENETGDPIDLLDPNSSSKILTVNPRKRKESRSEYGMEEMFSFNEEGKLVVSDERRGRRESGNDSEPESVETEMQSTTTAGVSSNTSRKSFVKKPRRNKSIADGREYKSQKAGGDMKRRNRPDPYAYLPLNKGQLRIKRKQKKLQGSLKAILKKAGKGSAHGKKVRYFKTK